MDEGAALTVDNGASDSAAGPLRRGGEVRFASTDERDAACIDLERKGLIVAELEGVGPSARGRLGEAIDEAIEHALAARGASSPGIASTGDRDAALSDQLFRARRVGAQGVAVVLGPLRAASGALGALEPEDCATLRFLARAARERPLTMLLDRRDATTGAYADPIALAAVLERDGRTGPMALATAPATPTAPALATEVPSTPLRHTAGAVLVERQEPWRAWTLQLSAARGPQPLASLEKLFVEAYMPLANALAAGLDDARARHAHDEFAASFSKGYGDAFPTFASTTKRPRMVFDAHDVAARIARLHGARSTRLLLVDAMRFDVSRLLEERLVAKLGTRASLTDELLLWSALPTVTMRQLETIARGVEALRQPATADPENEPPRGRTSEYVRRMRIGPREIHKLDVIETRLQSARGRVMHEMPENSEAAAEAIARHADTLGPRTLLFVFGDHGFQIDKNGAARQGGASPEEVLVGAFALLVGDVH